MNKDHGAKIYIIVFGEYLNSRLDFYNAGGDNQDDISS